MKLLSNIFHAAGYVLFALLVLFIVLQNATWLIAVMVSMCVVGLAGVVFALYVWHATGKMDSCMGTSLALCATGFLFSLVVVKSVWYM